MEDAVNQLINLLDARVAHGTEDSLIGIMENIDDEHIMEFVRGSLGRATCSMLTSIFNDEGVRDAFETAVIQVATSSLMVSAIVKALVKE